MTIDARSILTFIERSCAQLTRPKLIATIAVEGRSASTYVRRICQQPANYGRLSSAVKSATIDGLGGGYGPSLSFYVLQRTGDHDPRILSE
jgi:hypothetical protein